MKRNFDVWFGTFRESIADYSYYTNFPKVYANIDAIKIELNILNSLLGSKTVVKDFIHLTQRFPETLKCIPLLLAIRQMEITATDEGGTFTYNFAHSEHSTEQYVVFMEKTGLFDLISGSRISNLVDYATGVEVGLDSNGRKNRGGTLMEDLVEKYIKRTYATEYYTQYGVRSIQQKWGVDLNSITNDGKAEKRFDFVVHNNDRIFAIETNFYASSGSKLNETARSYKSLALSTKHMQDFEFIWITDGKGWISAKHNLQETFDVLGHVYNIRDLENGVLHEVFGKD
jgi:type II restriction enzyme